MTIKARTHRPILTGSAVKSAEKSADSTTESADSYTDSGIIGGLSLLNMVNILEPMESDDVILRIIGVGRWEIGPVGTGHYLLFVL